MSFPYKDGDFVIINTVEYDIPVRGLYKYQVAFVDGVGNFLVYAPEGYGWQIRDHHGEEYPNIPIDTWVWWFNNFAFASLCHEVIRVDTVD